MASVEPRTAKCAYCGDEFKTMQPMARFCRASHRVASFKKAQLEKLKRLEAKHG